MLQSKCQLRNGTIPLPLSNHFPFRSPSPILLVEQLRGEQLHLLHHGVEGVLHAQSGLRTRLHEGAANFRTVLDHFVHWDLPVLVQVFLVPTHHHGDLVWMLLHSNTSDQNLNLGMWTQWVINSNHDLLLLGGIV